MLKKYGKEYFLGAIITLGIVYGDIGTSPLYVMNALIGDQGGVSRVTPNYIIGCLSLIFWTLMIITTIKYVVIAMRAELEPRSTIARFSTIFTSATSI